MAALDQTSRSSGCMVPLNKARSLGLPVIVPGRLKGQKARKKDEPVRVEELRSMRRTLARLRRERAPLSCHQVALQVALRHELTLSQVMGEGFAAANVRFEVFFECYAQVRQASLPVIAWHFGKTPATVLYGIRKHARVTQQELPAGLGGQRGRG